MMGSMSLRASRPDIPATNGNLYYVFITANLSVHLL